MEAMNRWLGLVMIGLGIGGVLSVVGIAIVEVAQRVPPLETGVVLAAGALLGWASQTSPFRRPLLATWDALVNAVSATYDAIDRTVRRPFGAG